MAWLMASNNRSRRVNSKRSKQLLSRRITVGLLFLPFLSPKYFIVGILVGDQDFVWPETRGAFFGFVQCVSGNLSLML
jgi:hypothetical protein